MKRIVFFLCCLLITSAVVAQQPGQPFYKDIQAFKKADSLQPPPRKPVLFIGSSSFTMWKEVQAAFPKHTIVNRGFGGSSLPHLVNYANNIIHPYDAKQIVIYCGENDLTESDTISAQTVAKRFQTLFHQIRAKQPKVPIVYVSIKPSPSRAHLMPKMVEANRLIEAFLQQQKKAKFVNVYPLMLDEIGKPKEDIFLQDRLHMNAKGYAIWQKALKPHLKK